MKHHQTPPNLHPPPPKEKRRSNTHTQNHQTSSPNQKPNHFTIRTFDRPSSRQWPRCRGWPASRRRLEHVARKTTRAPRSCFFLLECFGVFWCVFFEGSPRILRFLFFFPPSPRRALGARTNATLVILKECCKWWLGLGGFGDSSIFL